MEQCIRKARIEDAEAIARIVRLADVFPGPESETYGETVRGVRRQLEMCAADDSHAVYVAVDGKDAVVGYAAVHWLPYPVARGMEGYVSDLFVDGAARGQGIGGRLLHHVKAEARRRGCHRLMLLNGRESEAYRRGFYHRRGWIERPTIANFILPLIDRED